MMISFDSVRKWSDLLSFLAGGVIENKFDWKKWWLQKWNIDFRETLTKIISRYVETLFITETLENNDIAQNGVSPMDLFIVVLIAAVQLFRKTSQLSVYVLRNRFWEFWGFSNSPSRQDHLSSGDKVQLPASLCHVLRIMFLLLQTYRENGN